MKLTYAFVFDAEDWKKVDWKNSESDHWEINMIELEGNEKVMGHKKIDESICKVLQTSDNKLVAITKYWESFTRQYG